MKCPFCQTELSDEEEYAGLIVQCPHCADYFRIPAVRSCPVCAESAMDRRKICVHCGYNFETGEMLETTMEVISAIPLKLRLIDFCLENIPGIFRLPTLIGFGCCAGAALFLAGLGFWIAGLGALITAIFVWSFALMTYMQGLAFLATGELLFLRNAYEEMTGNCWSFFLTLSFLPVGLILLLMSSYAPAAS